MSRPLSRKACQRLIQVSKVPTRRIKSFHEVLTDAVNYYCENGWDSEKSLNAWCGKLRIAAERKTNDKDLARAHLTQIYRRLVVDGGVNKEIGKPKAFGLEKIKPSLRAELDRRIFISANLIKINREQAIDKTIQRFTGWVSSVPPDGTFVIDKVEQKAAIKKDIVQEAFERRRVAIDQGHKLASNIRYIHAVQTGAIALRWHSDWRQPDYDYRPKHKERDERIYLLRDSWALEKGLIKPANGYYDEITAAAEEPFCRCKALPVYSPRDLPDEYLTEKGKNELNRA